MLQLEFSPVMFDTADGYRSQVRGTKCCESNKSECNIALAHLAMLYRILGHEVKHRFCIALRLRCNNS